MLHSETPSSTNLILHPLASESGGQYTTPSRFLPSIIIYSKGQTI